MTRRSPGSRFSLIFFFFNFFQVPASISHSKSSVTAAVPLFPPPSSPLHRVQPASCFPRFRIPNRKHGQSDRARREEERAARPQRASSSPCVRDPVCARSRVRQRPRARIYTAQPKDRAHRGQQAKHGSENKAGLSSTVRKEIVSFSSSVARPQCRLN